MGRLEGKIAVITGGASGIGFETAKRFIAEGAFVYIFGRRQDVLNKALSELGDKARAVQGDTTKQEDLDRLFETIKSEKGGLDIVFANAGIGEFAPLGEITEEHYSHTFDVNVKGTIFTVQTLLPILRKGASVILTGSTVGVKGTAAMSIYSASKAAVRNLARSWSLDLAGTGIRVNILSPGLTETQKVMSLFDATGQKDQIVAEFEKAIPLNRAGSPTETAAVASFLASDDSTYMTGSEIFVDGGLAQI